MKESWKPGTLIYPLPAVLVSCGATPEEYNLLTVAWTGTVCTAPPMCYVSVRPERHSHALIARTGMPEVFPEMDRKTSILLSLQQDKQGSLLMILSEFAYANINLTKIQSRPTKQGLGDYMFFIDFEGSDQDVDVQTALNCLRLKLREVKVLGSYPII